MAAQPIHPLDVAHQAVEAAQGWELFQDQPDGDRLFFSPLAIALAFRRASSEQKWEQAVVAEDTTPLTDEEANDILHKVRRARRG